MNSFLYCFCSRTGSCDACIHSRSYACIATKGSGSNCATMIFYIENIKKKILWITRKIYLCIYGPMLIESIVSHAACEACLNAPVTHLSQRIYSRSMLHGDYIRLNEEIVCVSDQEVCFLHETVLRWEWIHSVSLTLFYAFARISTRFHISSMSMSELYLCDAPIFTLVFTSMSSRMCTIAQHVQFLHFLRSNECNTIAQHNCLWIN